MSGSAAARAMSGWSVCTRAVVGPRGRHISLRAAIWCSATSRTTGCCDFDELTAAVGVFRAPAGYSNGNTVDRLGRLVSCEHGHRRVTRTEHDGTVTVLTDRV